MKTATTADDDGKDYQAMTLLERQALAENLYITYPRIKRLLDKIDYCHQRSKITREPECLLIKGELGAGKTTLYERYESRYPRRHIAEGTIVPVLSAGIPMPATVKGLATRLLQKFGDPAAGRGTIVGHTLRIQHYIKSCSTELLILDEFQHFMDRDSDRVLSTISDWLKDLINETKIPIVLIGLPYAEGVLDANGQLARRFSARETLRPFGWGTAEQRDEFRKFLKILDEQLPLMERSGLAGLEMAYRFFCCSGGYVYRVMKTARRATALALEIKMERLTLELLAQAYADVFGEDGLVEHNPFDGDVSSVEDIGAASSASGARPTKADGGRKKAGGLRASEILHR